MLKNKIKCGKNLKPNKIFEFIDWNKKCDK